METLFIMCQKEIQHLDLIQAIYARRMRQIDVAEQLQLSLRQCKQYKEFGPTGLISKKRGMPYLLL